MAKIIMHPTFRVCRKQPSLAMTIGFPVSGFGENGYPHLGQQAASLDTLLPHSGQRIVVIVFALLDLSCVSVPSKHWLKEQLNG